jgi:ElaB/YqjD/DUF883 family membrane-anchored ribosome-binding protein
MFVTELFHADIWPILVPLRNALLNDVFRYQMLFALTSPGLFISVSAFAVISRINVLLIYKDPIMESTTNFPSGTNGVSNSGSRTEPLTTTAHTAVDKAGDIARPVLDRVAGGAHQAVDGVGSVARSVQSGTSIAHDRIDAATEAARPAVDRLLTGAHQAVDKLSGYAAVAADSVSEKSAQLKEAHAKLMANGRTQVREKPAMAIGIAVAAGFLLGRLLRSR